LEVPKFPIRGHRPGTIEPRTFCRIDASACQLATSASG
jgi:hypothetical protein